MSEYKRDKRYGFLIVNLAPFGLLSMLAVPLLFCVKDEKKLKSINSLLLQIGYSPLAFTATAVFLIVNFIMWPVACLAAIIKKVQLAVIEPGKSSFYEIGRFVALGWATLAF